MSNHLHQIPCKRFIDIAYEKLPFPLFRLIVESIGILPKLHTKVFMSLKEHFKDHYCKRCGEYKTSRQFHSGKIYHLSCRQQWYTPDYENTKYYHFRKLSIYSLLYSMDDSWRHFVVRCPVVFYSKQPTNYYKLDICTDESKLSLRGGAWVYYQYKKNVAIGNIYSNSKFTIIPELFSRELHLSYKRPLGLGIIQLMSGITKLDVMKRFKIHTKLELLHWLLRISPTVMQHLQTYEYSLLRRFLKQLPRDLRFRCIVSLEPNRLIRQQNTWIRDLLMDFPQILDVLNESNIQYFFKKHKKWFLRYLSVRPTALNYVSLVYQKHCNDKYYECNKTNRHQ